MKLKGVNAFEQHVEKIVLVAVSVVFLVVLATQFLLEPNRVKITGAKEPLPPGKAFLAVESKAKELQAQMTPPAESILPPAPKYDLVRQLQSRRASSLLPNGSALVLGGPRSRVPVEMLRRRASTASSRWRSRFRRR